MPGIRPVALLVVLLALPGTAWAGAREDLERGKKLLRDMEDAKGLQVLEGALKAPGLDDALRAQLHLHIGIAQSNLMRRNEAVASFKAALKADPEIRPPELTSPKIKALFEQVRLEVQKEAAQSKAPPRAKPAPRPAPQPAPPPAPAPAPSRINWPAWGLLGVAAVAGGVGIAMGALSRSDANKAADLTMFYSQAKELHDRARTRATAANVLLAVGGAAAIASGVLFYLGFRKAERASAAIVPVDSGILVQVSGVAWQ